MSADDPKRRLSVHDVIGALGDLPEGEDCVSVIRKQRDAADRPSVTDDTRAEAAAALRSTVDLDPRSDFDRGYAHGWHAAAEWAAGRAETTTATPPGLTVSEDGSVLNWQGVNYVPQRAETTTDTTKENDR